MSVKMHPETNIDGFTAMDGTVRFFGFVRAVLLKTDARQILDFGAGRGGAWYDDKSAYRRHMRDLRAFGGTVTACDVDKVVLSHPCSDRQVVIMSGQKFPFDDEAFDVIISDMTFEHIDNPEIVAQELLRVLKPGGYICARTPNLFGYVRILTELVPKSMRVRVLSWVQPDRKPEDVFRTVYRMNSPSQIRRLFEGCEVYYFGDSAEPAYYFGSRFIYSLFLMVHKLLPSKFATTICLFIKKEAHPIGPLESGTV